MIKLDFNNHWMWRRLHLGEWQEIELPHDAMLFEQRKDGVPGGANSGWYECHDYEYAKRFLLPEEYKNKKLTFEFEGVYHNSEVYINGKLAQKCPYGYTNFYVPANKYLHFGEENNVYVLARNADQPNSRWYSGAGIYRPVHLLVTDERHIKRNGIKIRTLQIHPAIVEIEVSTSCDGEVSLKIERGEQLLTYRAYTRNKVVTFRAQVDDAALWTPDHPNLYNLTAKFYTDERQERFGIRTLSCSPEQGFCLNGERIILRGACIHHDNGILGARCYPEAEYRKIALLKENGYNAVRSAHNPCSKAMLNACDELGMMVVDEYVDMWYIHKTKHDYAAHVPTLYPKDITAMIHKDHNHPSVIMYSLGNEVAETGEKDGIELFKKMRDLCHKLDPTRPVTVGVNIFFNCLYSMGLGVYSDKKANTHPKAKVGSEFFNDLAGLTGAGFMKFMATLYPCDLKTRDCFAETDVAGYNYGILRYRHDLRKYKKRIILGSETFCSDAYKFYELAKKNKALIGDFVWSGMDYLGEIGVGSWEYKDYADSFTKGVGWISAGSGRLDLIGNPLGEALYTKVAFEFEDKPQIAVVPVNHTHDRHSPSAWKFSNAIPSWSWNGLNGKSAKVEVYSRAPVVELYVNGKKAGRKKRGRNCRLTFNVKYYDGEVTAVNLDKEGHELARTTLKTAGDHTVLSVTPEKSVVKKGELCFIHLDYTDENGTIKPLERGYIQIQVEGGELLAAGHACPFNKDGYLHNYTDTYYGRAMAVVKATGDIVRINASGNSLVGACDIYTE